LAAAARRARGAIGAAVARAVFWGGPAAAGKRAARPPTLGGALAPGGGAHGPRRRCGRGRPPILSPHGVHRHGGARGRQGSARVAKAAPDGYQFVLGSRADAINQTLYKNPLYNFATDLAPVVLIADQPTLLVARKDLPAADLREFIAYARANQTKMQMASA